MARPGSERADGDWCKELAALKGHPVHMLLAAVYLRAKEDAAANRAARRFVERVRANCEQEDPGYAVIRAMRGGIRQKISRPR